MNSRTRKAVYRKRYCWPLFLCLTALINSSVLAQPEFQDISKSAGVEVMHLTPEFDTKLDHIMMMVSAGASGGAVGDYNNDGFLDIFVNVPRAGAENVLLKNNGNMTFSNVTKAAGLEGINDRQQVASMGLFLDYNGDGWQDLLVVRFGYLALFKNKGDGTFADVSKQAGFTHYVNALTAIAFDYDKDGDLDIYLGSYFRDINMFSIAKNERNILHDSWEVSRNGGSNLFYVNNGDGTFSERTKSVGLEDTGWTMALAHGDFNGDGWQDIYVANDYGSDMFFVNNKQGKFINVTKTAMGFDTKKGMNADAGDFDNDGDLDVFVTNVTEEFLYECNMLWQNSGRGDFVDVSQELGVCDTGWGWAGKFFDYNNDGWLDLYVANGFFTGTEAKDYLEVLLPAIWESGEDPSDPKMWPPVANMGMASSEKNVLFTNKNHKFVREKNSGLELALDSRAILTGDFDNDGKVDVFVTNNANKTVLFRNTTAGGHWIELQLQGKSPNTDAVGARLYLTANKVQQMREVNIGNGFGGGSMTRQHFGLGDADKIDQLKVIWPNGEEQVYKNLNANQIIVLNQAKYGISKAWKKHH